MNNNMSIPTSPTYQWMDDIQMPYNNYQQTQFEQPINTPYENFSHSTIMTTNNMTTTNYPHDNQYSNLSPDNSCGDTKSASSKPVRRRSRASKKTPTTLVNASISNFRAVVQQYTGCHTCPINNQKGPINLSFGSQENSSIVGDASKYGYYNNSQDMNGTTTTHAGYSNSGSSRFGVEDYGCD
uniref:VQ domain-containing protein n=1 Tax=Solanum lycopersicum TaxID=4081 RepID=A0A3Q7EX01_SOLLC